jgi:hypothetical protein
MNGHYHGGGILKRSETNWKEIKTKDLLHALAKPGFLKFALDLRSYAAAKTSNKLLYFKIDSLA